jgi:hypothetical protein
MRVKLWEKMKEFDRGFTIILPSFYHAQISGIKKPTARGWFS